MHWSKDIHFFFFIKWGHYVREQYLRVVEELMVHSEEPHSLATPQLVQCYLESPSCISIFSIYLFANNIHLYILKLVIFHDKKIKGFL